MSDDRSTRRTFDRIAFRIVSSIDGAIAGAASIVDLALRGRYALPLSPLDQVITEIVCDLARTRLYGQATEVPESVLAADKAARGLLQQIASGAYQLTAAVASADNGNDSDDLVEASGEEPVFSTEKLEGF